MHLAQNLRHPITESHAEVVLLLGPVGRSLVQQSQRGSVLGISIICTYCYGVFRRPAGEGVPSKGSRRNLHVGRRSLAMFSIDGYPLPVVGTQSSSHEYAAFAVCVCR